MEIDDDLPHTLYQVDRVLNLMEDKLYAIERAFINAGYM